MSRPSSGSHAAELPAALLDTGAWADGLTPDDCIQTHISWVFLVGEEAYKVKKPIRFDFVDFSTLERRRHFCEEELRINRRFAPDLYLGLATVVQTLGGVRVRREGMVQPGDTVVDYAVRMRRFDRRDELDALVAAGQATADSLRGFGVRLARMHELSPMARTGTMQAGTLDTALQNFDVLEQQAPASLRDRLTALRSWTKSMHDRLAGTFEQRLASGRYRECHGDLHCGNVVRHGPGLWAFDALEFDPALRWIDVASDLAFLSMDLQARSGAGLRAALLDGWLADSGDFGALTVLPFYETYRACVRAKVAAIRAAQEVAGPQTAEVQAIDRYITQAGRSAWPAPAVLVVLTGPSGSGKSWLAERLLGPLGAVRVRSDVERKRLHGLNPGDASEGRIYGVESTSRTYQRLLEIAAIALQAGFSTVIDAACLRREQRQQFIDLGGKLGVATRLVALQAPTELLRQRIIARAEMGKDPSEADTTVLARQLGTAEPLGDAERAAALVVRTDEVDVERLAAELDVARPAAGARSSAS